MIYLIVKMMVLLFLAAGFGLAFGWIYRGAREREAAAARNSHAAARLTELRQERDTAESARAAAVAKADTAARRVAELEAALADTSARQALPDRSDAGAPAAPVEPLVDRPVGALPASGPPDLTPDADAPTPEPAPELAPAPARDVAEAGDAPPGYAVSAVIGAGPRPMDRPADGGDDLKRISGVGPKLEELLHDLGIWRYQQIADFTADDIAWVDERLSFKGRIEREDWVAQAKALADEIDA